MKKLLLSLFSFGTLISLAQAPPMINYQGVARSTTGAPLPGTAINMTVTVSNSSSSYSEQHSTTTNNVGLFTIVIGNGTSQVGSLSTFNWAINPTNLTVNLQAGSSAPVTIGPQQLVSVPYALYAGSSGSSGTPTLTVSGNTVGLSGGNSVATPTYIAGSNVTITGPGAANSYTINATGMPSGTVTGQTAYWNQTTNNWVPNVNLNNDGTRVGVGIGPGSLDAKLRVHQAGGGDSSALFVDLLGGNARHAAVRGFASGTSASSQYAGAVSGGHFRGINLGSGTGVGVIAEGNGGFPIGIFATAYGSAPNKWAGIFEGQVQITDSVFFTGTPNTGVTGDVITRSSTGRLYWKTPSAASASPWVSSAGSTTLVTATDNVFIGTSSGSSKLNISTLPGFGGNDVQITSGGNSDGIQVLKVVGGGAAGRFVNSTSTSTAVIDISSSAGNPNGININMGGNGSALFATVNGNGATIWGNNNTGPAVRGTKSGGSTAAGHFEHTSTTANGDAVYASQVGKGAAVHAIMGSAVSGSSNVAVWLEQGHLKASGTAPTSSITGVGGTLSFGVTQVTVAVSGACSDVGGCLLVTFPSGTWVAGDYIDVNLTYNKAYTSTPRVLANAIGQPLLCYITGTSATGVTLRVQNISGSIGSINQFSFNYFVIEN